MTGLQEHLYRILIVDDDLNILQVLKMRLELMGYEVTTCNDPRKAMDMFATGNFSLVLTDQKMGEISGTELMEELRGQDPHLPVIIMTAFGTVNDAVESIRHGAFNYIEKPIDTAQLETQIKTALERKALEQRLAMERDLWSRAIKSLGAGLLLMDAEENITWMGQIPKDLLLKTPKDPNAKCSEIIGNKVMEAIKNPRLKALQTGKSQSIEYRDPVTKNWFHITFTPLRNPSGEFLKTVILFQDITDAKKAEESRMEQERLKGTLEMAGAVAHELSQPLQAILGWSEIMLSQKAPQPYKRYLESICKQIDILKEMISQITSITRYAKKDYPGSLSIIDIQKASADSK